MSICGISIHDRKKYDRKKKESEKRKISFDITIEQYIKLNELISNGLTKCFYTGVNFVHRKDHPYYPTLERLCDRMPYRIDNVVWVTKKSNEIKDSVFDKKSVSPSSLNESDLNISRMIKSSFNDIDKREEVRDFYIRYCCGNIESNKFEITHKLSDLTESLKQKITDDTSEPPFVCDDIEISTYYQDFYKAHNKMDFDLPFSEFKSLITSGRCDLTGERIYSISDAMIFVKSDDKPLSLSNCVTTTRDTYFACLALIEKIGVEKSISAITSLHRIFKEDSVGEIEKPNTVEEIGTPLSKAIREIYSNDKKNMFVEGDDVFIFSTKKKSHGAICTFNKYTLSGESLTASLTRKSDNAIINASVKDIIRYSEPYYSNCFSVSKPEVNDPPKLMVL